jgi:hypothetical protein
MDIKEAVEIVKKYNPRCKQQKDKDDYLKGKE